MTRTHDPWRNLLPIVFLAWPVVAEPASMETPKETYSGSALFKTYCASCHGPAAKGDGPLADHLRFHPQDLTLLARRNKGKWDGDKVGRTIDGRNPLKGHGGTDMPVWGDAFKSSKDRYDEGSVKQRIQALVAYLESLQAPVERGPVDSSVR